MWNNILIRARSDVGYALLNTPIQLPSEFEISYTLRCTSNDYKWNYVVIGESGSGHPAGGELNLNVGKLNSSGMHIRDGNGNILANSLDGVVSDKSYPVRIIYQNGTLSLNYNNITISTSNISVSLEYLIGIGIGRNGLLGEIKIKPL